MNRGVLTRPGALTGIAIIASGLLLTACSTAGNSPGTASSAIGRVPVGSASGNMAGSASGGGPAVPTPARPAGLKATQTAKLVPVSQSIIYTASLTMRSKTVTANAQRAIAIAVAAGGYTADEHATSSHGRRGPAVVLTLKVPVPGYQAVLTKLSSPAFGTQLSMKQQATDVTQEVADVNSLVTSQEAAITALQGLLRHAASVSGLLQVQQQISEDESTLNALLSQQRALNHETSYATVTMDLVSPLRPAPAKKPAHRGFGAGLAAGWHALGRATAWTLTALGAALPFLVVAAVVGVAGLLGWRYRQRRGTGPTPAA